MRQFTRMILVAATAVLVLASPGRKNAARPFGLGEGAAMAQAEDPEIVNQAKAHFKAGQDAFAAGKYDVAIRELKRAYVLKRFPAILINIATTYRKTKDYDMALYFYRKFLSEAPADDKARSKAEAEMAEVEQERVMANQPAPAAKPAVEVAKSAPSAAPAPSAPSKPANASVATASSAPKSAASEPSESSKSEAAPAVAAAQNKPVTEWSHIPIDAVPPGKPVDVRVQMPVMKSVKVKVYFRTEGQAQFDSLELKRRGSEKIARLPESVTQGRTFQYYLEARDSAGTLIKSSGSDASPNIVLIETAARPQLVDASGVEDSSEEDEPARRVKTGPSRDIENEVVRFDIASAKQQKAAEERRAEQRAKARDKKPSPLHAMGWAGVGIGALGAGALIGGFTFLGLAAKDAAIVSADSRCDNAKMRCLFYGPNPDPMLNKAPNPSSSAYEQQGKLYDKVGIALTAVGGVTMAAGAGLLIADLVRNKHRTEQARTGKKLQAQNGAAKTDTVFSLLPVAGPAGGGFVGELDF